MDTDKNDGRFADDGTPLPRQAKSRLVVIGFRDKLLGCYRRDAPTASRLVEALLLALAAIFGMLLALGDVKNAYFNGRRLQRAAPATGGDCNGRRPGERVMERAVRQSEGARDRRRRGWA